MQTQSTEASYCGFHTCSHCERTASQCTKLGERLCSSDLRSCLSPQPHPHFRTCYVCSSSWAQGSCEQSHPV